ncbi:MAG: exonuclease subunit SbcD [Sphingobacteriales bacterium]|nr:MAG: exonuclease subunit SbcD [Sphingobacteriales bacterium]
MKILHTADWHLGKRLEKFSRLNEQMLVLEEIIEIANTQKVDIVLIAGDLFDAFNPPTEAVELFYKTLKRLTNNGTRAVVAIAGNHDSPDRIEAPDPLARECGIFFSGYPDTQIAVGELDNGIAVLRSEAGFLELKIPNYNYPLRILLTPYANEFRLKTFLGNEDDEAELRQILQQQWQTLANTYCDNKGVNILMAHLFFMKKDGPTPTEPDDEKPILHLGGAQAIYSQNIPTQMQYVALGHLHRFQIIDDKPCPIVYSSSPLSYSFAEAQQQKYVVVLDVEPNGLPVKITKIALTQGRPLHRKKFDEISEAIVWLQENPDTLVELTLVTNDYLTAENRKQLLNAHDGIITIIPEIKNLNNAVSDAQSRDLNQNIDELFVEFFNHKKGQNPNIQLLDLFKEIRAQSNAE